MSEKEQAASRRDFLRLAGASAPAALAAAAVAPAEAQASEEGPAGEGLRRTEHTLKYLESARF